MSGNFRKEDLRIIKTRKALLSALSSLLKQYKFSKITVHDICTEALVSRTAFYAHFKDKYDLLQKWLIKTKSEIFIDLRSGKDNMENSICSALRTNAKLIENLLSDANLEQWQLLLDFFSLDDSVLLKPNKESGCDKILSDFFSGGILNLLHAQICEHREMTETEITKAVSCVYGIIKLFLNGEGKYDDKR
ncbi:hypothetical protein FACS1894105_10040 [Clostridia bacterium]|nr:hypothetical protein FACS1894105_10040 [Clostridia bacterium]